MSDFEEWCEEEKFLSVRDRYIANRVRSWATRRMEELGPCGVHPKACWVSPCSDPVCSAKTGWCSVCEREKQELGKLADAFYTASGVEGGPFDVAGTQWTPADLVAAVRKQAVTQAKLDALKAKEPPQPEPKE